MLEITIPGGELYNPNTDEFITLKGQTLQLEHSLIALSKWESKWKKPFLGKEDRTPEESLDYVRCMTITPNVDPMLYKNIPQSTMNTIKEYIDSPMTATWFHEDKRQAPSRNAVTAEIIYYWMISNNIPFECQKWHLNRLLTLIRVCSIKNAPQKKRSKRESMQERRALMASRRSKTGTS